MNDRVTRESHWELWTKSPLSKEEWQKAGDLFNKMLAVSMVCEKEYYGPVDGRLRADRRRSKRYARKQSA